MSNARDAKAVANVRRAIRLYESRAGRHIVADSYPERLCVYCGQPATSRDHVLPLSHGGLHTQENMVPACRRCNGMKRDLLPHEFFALHRKAAWHFARRAVHAKATTREMARQYGRDYEPRAFFDGAEEP